MWGTREKGLKVLFFIRFIPTHVGNTSPISLMFFSSSVHPHACGEHSLPHSPNGENPGSSPRMWGTHMKPQKRIQTLRFIPTHVGNTGDPSGVPLCSAVHPHACGEHDGARGPGRDAGGSSPRMWGTLKGSESVAAPARFIPTHVGNTRM